MTDVYETPLEQVAYVHDGTLEGLLTCVFLAYERHEAPEDIVDEAVYEPRLGQSALFVETDLSKAERVRAGVVKAQGRDSFSAIMRASTCDDYDTGSIVYRFIRYAMARSSLSMRKPILDELANPAVADLIRLAKHATNEAERMRQFVRFSHLENGVWFSQVCPNASVVPLVMGYFAARLNDQPFIIYDKPHGLAGVYDGCSWQLVCGEVNNVPQATEHDGLMQEAWKRFYDALTIDARYNPELRRKFMPMRLWGGLTELQPWQSVPSSAPALCRFP